MKFRHELKHEINAADRIMICQRLRAVAKLDAHAAGGTYKIKSLYFDDAADTALFDKINGAPRREKFRIRYYNDDTEIIRLEKKSKIDNLCSKQSCSLSKAEAQAIIDGRLDWMSQSDRPLIRELYVRMINNRIRPKAVVEYTRIPFVYGPGNVRVTIDYDLRTSAKTEDFLSNGHITIPVVGAPIILEVKWDEFLPDIIRDAVRIEGRMSGAFSKYAACRVSMI